jgi:hypothetical protein
MVQVGALAGIIDLDFALSQQPSILVRASPGAD